MTEEQGTQVIELLTNINEQTYYISCIQNVIIGILIGLTLSIILAVMLNDF